MIRIKDSIFNENEIQYIMEYSEKELQIIFKDHSDIYVEATFDDIEWNYGSSEKIQIDKLEEELNELKSDYSLVVAENKKYKEKFGKARKYMFLNANYNEYMSELLSGLPSGNCNELLKILDGE